MKRRGRARKRPLTRSGVFRAFSPARFIFTLYCPLFRMRIYARFYVLSLLAIPHLLVRGFSFLKSSLFSRPLSRPLQNAVRKILRILPLLTIRNDFFLSSTANFRRCFFIFPAFPCNHNYTTSFQFSSASLPTLFRH